MLARPARLVARPTLRARLSLSPSLASALLPARAMMSSWSFDGIEYRRLDPDYDPEALFAFNKEHGSTPLNFIPDEPVREHFRRLATGETTVWAAFAGDEMAGFISGELGGGYWLQTGAGQEHSSDNDGSTCFINEFVVNPKFRGKRIGVRLTTASIDPELGIWATDPAIHEMYTTVHVDNLASRTAFIKVRAVSAVSADAVSSSPRRSPQQHRMVLGGAGCMGSFIRGGRFLLPPPSPAQGGYSEVLTYADQHRDRNTTVLKKAKPGSELAAAPRGNTRTMRVVGVQSGNAVDGIDVGIFDFEPVRRSEAVRGPRAQLTKAPRAQLTKTPRSGCRV
jgi:ribosomal protein S18 acetylase RimI-like enzyme